MREEGGIMNVERAPAKVAERDPRPSHLGCRRASQGFWIFGQSSQNSYKRAPTVVRSSSRLLNNPHLPYWGGLLASAKISGSYFFCSLTDEGAGNTGVGLKLMSAS